jgi:hypothetical protein
LKKATTKTKEGKNVRCFRMTKCPEFYPRSKGIRRYREWFEIR